MQRVLSLKKRLFLEAVLIIIPNNAEGFCCRGQQFSGREKSKFRNFLSLEVGLRDKKTR